jgi:phosphonate transport system permease protein
MRDWRLCSANDRDPSSIETADSRPIEGTMATGGGRLAVIRLGIQPQVLPIFASNVLYFLKSNTRSAAIVGIVCAGCLVLHLPEMLRVLAVT